MSLKKIRKASYNDLAKELRELNYFILKRTRKIGKMILQDSNSSCCRIYPGNIAMAYSSLPEHKTMLHMIEITKKDIYVSLENACWKCLTKFELGVGLQLEDHYVILKCLSSSFIRSHMTKLLR